MSYYVDTHCHLDLFPGIRTAVDTEDRLPIKTITVTNVPTLWKPNMKLFGESANIRVALGIHPELASQRTQELAEFSTLSSATKYIGEIGLDGTSNEAKERQTQLMVFQYVLNTIKKQDPKILTVHSRGAARETISELINVLKGTHHHVILHWYSGKIDDMRQALAAGFSFSVNHKMVISRTGQQLVQALPKNSLLTETDAPFTFSESITNRQQSLQATIAGLARQWQCEPEEARNHVWQTFADVLKNTQAMKP